MGKPKGKRKAKIRVKTGAKVKERNDATSVARPDTVGLRRAPTRLAPDAGANFRIKIKKK